MEDRDDLKKRRGRPPRNPEGAKVGNITFRVRDGMRERLQASADARGLSISEDVEKRIERTFDFDYLLGDNETALVLRSIANAVQRFEKASGKAWVQDSETQARVHEAVSKMVDVLLEVRPEIDDRAEPSGEGLPVDWNDPEMRVGFRTMALDAAIHDLQAYRNLKEQELKRLRPAGRAHREARREQARSLPSLPQETRLTEVAAAEAAHIAAALKNRTPGTAVGVGRVNDGPLVSEQAEDGTWHELLPGAQPFAEDAREARAAIEQALDLVRLDPPEGADTASPAQRKRRTRSPA